MIKPRIIKKLSKRLVEILPKMFKDAWVDTEVEWWTPHHRHNQDVALTRRQIRENHAVRGCRINNIMSVGGGVDYWGEGEDWETVYAFFRSHIGWFGPFGFYDEGEECWGYPKRDPKRQTGKRLIQLARILAANKEESFERGPHQ